MTGTRRKTGEPPMPPDDLLGSSPFEGDLVEELAAEPRPRRRLPSLTVFLGAGILIVGGFVGGVQADRHWGSKKSVNPTALINQLAARRGGGQGGGGGFGGGGFPRQGTTGSGTTGSGAAGGGTTGTVKLVDGDIIYIQTPNGIVRVKTTGSTKVTTAQKSSVKKLKTGSTVVVQGTPGQDGTVTATSVSQGSG